MKQTSDMSKKPCVCGGHNATNVKKNKHHNSTRAKLEIKAARKMKAMEAEYQAEDADREMGIEHY